MLGTGTRGPRPSFMSGEQPVRTNTATQAAKAAMRASGLPVPGDTRRDERVADRTFFIQISRHGESRRGVAPDVRDACAPIDRGGEGVPRKTAHLPPDVPSAVVIPVGGIARGVAHPIPVGVPAKVQESTQTRAL